MSEESNLTGSPFIFNAAHYALFSQGILLQHPVPPVGTIPRTHIIPTQINTITFFPFISNLISNPLLNFLAIVKDNVENNHNRPQIKDNPILFLYHVWFSLLYSTNNTSSIYNSVSPTDLGQIRSGTKRTQRTKIRHPDKNNLTFVRFRVNTYSTFHKKEMHCMTEKQAEAEIRTGWQSSCYFVCRRRSSSPRKNLRRHSGSFVKGTNLSHIIL